LPEERDFTSRIYEPVPIATMATNGANLSGDEDEEEEVFLSDDEDEEEEEE
jgi:hypothetical protein